MLLLQLVIYPHCWAEANGLVEITVIYPMIVHMIEQKNRKVVRKK